MPQWSSVGAGRPAFSAASVSLMHGTARPPGVVPWSAPQRWIVSVPRVPMGLAGTVGGLPGSPAITAPPFSMIIPDVQKWVSPSSKVSSPPATTLTLAYL